MSRELDVHADEHDVLIIVNPKTGEELHLSAREAEYLVAALVLTNSRYSLPAYSSQPIRYANSDVRAWLGRIAPVPGIQTLD
jgi:hypothetical protein